jgi:hypothetical protein
MSNPPLRSQAASCKAAQAAGSLKCGLALTPGSDPESASSFLRGASSRRPGHPVCGPWRSVARNWRWPCPPRWTQEARTPDRPVRAKLGHAIFLARSDSAFFVTCRVALEYAPAPKHQNRRLIWQSLSAQNWPRFRDRSQLSIASRFMARRSSRSSSDSARSTRK